MAAPVLPALDLVPLLDGALRHFVLLLRVGGFLVAAPLFGARYVPLQVRIVLGLVLTLPLAGRVPLPEPAQIASLAALPLFATEMLLGLVAGAAMAVLFSAASLAGDRIANTAGLGFAAQFDPTAGGQTPVVAQLFSFGLLAVFVATDGHLVALRILLESYATHPPGSPLRPELLLAALAAGGEMFALGLSLALPVMGLLVLLNIAVGVLTRSAPQFNVFSFGFPLTMAATLLMLFISAPQMGRGFHSIGEAALQAVSTLLEVPYGR